MEPDSNQTGSLQLKRYLQQVAWWQVVVVLLALVLAVAAVEQPYRFRRNSYQEDSHGQAYRWSEDGQIEHWRPVWDRVYLEWTIIAVGAGGAIALGSKTTRRLRCSQQTVLAAAVGALLLTCLFPPVHVTDRSNMPKPGEGRAYQTSDGIWLSADPILPRFVQADRFILSDYNGVRWRRLTLEWTGIIVLAFGGLVGSQVLHPCGRDKLPAGSSKNAAPCS